MTPFAPSAAASVGDDPASPSRFLLIRLSALGDVVNTLPTLSLLRRARPHATIGFVVEDRTSELLVGHPMVDRVHVFPRRRLREQMRRPSEWAHLKDELQAHAEEIRDGHYDVAIDVQGNLKGGLHSFFSGARRRIGFARGYDYEGNHWLSTEQVTPRPQRLHRVDKFASLLRPLGIEGTEREWVFPPTPPEARERVASFLQARGLAAGEIVVVHPGTSGHGAEKRWPADRFGELARRIDAELERRVVVTWGPGEEELARAVCGDSKGRVIAGPPTHSLLELLELLRAARLFVSADTGPMHLAAATGVSCVALFGPKDPVVYAPYGTGHTVIHRPDEPGRPGMQRITVDEVVAAASEQLGRA
ncbi:MAG: glycosyltransferase family 9 protein [Deltaproteobacteria bacterium]|nr:glycosyltransferase family 9 protein [Deltaproteobacteria bacterium]